MISASDQEGPDEEDKEDEEEEDKALINVIKSSSKLRSKTVYKLSGMECCAPSLSTAFIGILTEALQERDALFLRKFH